MHRERSKFVALSRGAAMLGSGATDSRAVV